MGDSRALLCRNGKARRLTSDHCPLLLAEKVLVILLLSFKIDQLMCMIFMLQNRVEQSQGEIFIDSSGRGLVNGRLAMTRSLGDLELKPFGVTAVPDVRKMKVYISHFGSKCIGLYTCLNFSNCFFSSYKRGC